ncbi:MAG: adenylate/guanylate cyclase domain-containing protein [Bacteroidota bacterium]
MNAYQKRRIRILTYYLMGWTLAFLFLSIIRGVGTQEQGNLQFDFRSSMLISFSLGPMFGLLSGVAQILIEERMFRRISIRNLLFLRMGYALCVVGALILLSFGAYRFLFGTQSNLISFAFERGSISIYLYILVVDLILNIFRQVNMMLGDGNLWKHLYGKFYTPREEARIFMFLDLQSSTQLAETLGHLTYSSLIQDCFNDLGVVAEHEAEIYQYVGDEAVLTWELKNGLSNQNCLLAFFKFKKRLALRASYYRQQYNCTPFFKAGLHCGIVTVTEIGKFKREIAYHGDPVNTAARIQAQCNTYGKELLISETLKDILPTDKFGFEQVGDLSLKGKQKNVVVYAAKELNG